MIFLQNKTNVILKSECKFYTGKESAPRHRPPFISFPKACPAHTSPINIGIFGIILIKHVIDISINFNIIFYLVTHIQIPYPIGITWECFSRIRIITRSFNNATAGDTCIECLICVIYTNIPCATRKKSAII